MFIFKLFGSVLIVFPHLFPFCNQNQKCLYRYWSDVGILKKIRLREILICRIMSLDLEDNSHFDTVLCGGVWRFSPPPEPRCKELCPHEIVPLKKRQVYAKCGGMIPGYGGHVPGYSICTLGNNFRFAIIVETSLYSLRHKFFAMCCILIIFN